MMLTNQPFIENRDAGAFTQAIVDPQTRSITRNGPHERQAGALYCSAQLHHGTVMPRGAPPWEILGNSESLSMNVATAQSPTQNVILIAYGHGYYRRGYYDRGYYGRGYYGGCILGVLC
jgi:hypothetical protein